MADVYIMADAPFLVQREDGVLLWRVNYRLTEAVNNNIDGTVDVPIGDKTESELNIDIANGLAAEANLQANTTQFTADAVKGGRI